ncbi:MAG TPA: alpha/beta hydrolase [Bdellovibrionales bacterium]|nr:alpha/beta hydrolase [Bdellovibrionales bacterium]
MKLNGLQFALLILGFPSLMACQQGPGNQSTAVDRPLVTKVTKENFINGEKFCATYKKITAKEHSRLVTVPQDYAHPEKGTLEIYVYTTKSFDPSLPTYIFVDGGPGQNTHGRLKNYTPGVNELRFDQRGLGCSTPKTFELYKQARLYSTKNTVRDMDEIRKAYGIDKWTVYGLSYGTVPATQYGSLYPDSTQSVVLEGVVGNADFIHMNDYKAEKINLALKSLNSDQRMAFSQIMAELSTRRPSRGAVALIELMFGQFYQDNGMRELADLLSTKIISPWGEINRAGLNRLADYLDSEKRRFPFPQQPGAVDQNILDIIYCKDLNGRNRGDTELNYSHSRGFFEEYTGKSHKRAQECDDLGVFASQTKAFDAGDYPISAPVYYFQGTHDGATLAKGAMKHWQSSPKGRSYFMLEVKGGHNPNLRRMESESASLKSAQRALFKKAVLGEAIGEWDLADANKDLETRWVLSLDPQNPGKLDDLFDGILLTNSFPTAAGF